MKTTQVIVVVFMFLFCGINLHAQENYYKTYSVNDGLLSSDNYMTLQDSKGYMWICSSKGITKFDGKNFTYFTVKDGLPTNDIWYIKEDSKQRIWIGGFFKGLYYILNDSVVKLKSEIDANRILLNVEFNDTLIFCSDLNNYYLENNKLEKYNVKKVDYRKIRSSDNSIEFNHHLNQEFNEVRLLKYNKDLRLNMQHIDYKSFLLNNDKQFVLSNDKRKMTIYFDSVIKIIDVENYFGGVISEIKTITPTKEVMIKINDSIRVYKNLLTLERNKNMEEKLLPFLSTRIGWITIDNEKNLWITEYRGVIIFIPFNNQNIIRSNIKVKKDGNNIFNLTYFNHKVYFNSLTGNLYSYKTNNKQINKIQNRDFNVFGDDILFVGKYYNKVFYNKMEKLFIIKNNVTKAYTVNDPDETLSPRYMVFKNDSSFITGRFSEFVIRGNLLFLKDKSAYIIPEKISTIIETKNYFISGGAKKLYLLNKKSKQKTTFPISGVQAIKELNGLVIVGTNDNGMILIDYEGNVITKKHIGLSINDIEIQEDLIYLATNKGIIIEKFFNNRFETVKHITNSDGLTSDEVNSIAITDSLLFAGTVDGFNQINLKAILTEKGLAPKVYMSSFIVNDSLSKTNNVMLRYNENNIAINYTAVSFHSLGNISYSHRLIGLGDKWNSTTENSVKYWSLPSGDYTFEVKAFNSKGLESENSVKFHFSIKNHFTETWWFISLVLLWILLFISWVFYQFQKRRTRKLLTEKKFADLELRALQSQMNPHFIFNSLNAIQSVMFLKGEKETNKYIGAFSKLMRLTLDNSKESVITLENEIEYQQTYIDLEKRRLNGELNYSIEISEEVNPEEIKIPSMIFQPLIENAIIHGLIPKKQNRNLKIRFSIEDNLLVGTVIDDGVGREASLKKQKGKEYKSWASTILKEKVEVLNRLNQSNMEYIITDLEENNIPCGTKITVKLPLNYGN